MGIRMAEAYLKKKDILFADAESARPQRGPIPATNNSYNQILTPEGSN
jgi:hypothetical protein